MNSNESYFEQKGCFVAIAAFAVSLMLFYSNSSSFFYSVFAALLLSALTWGSYLVIRMMLLTYRK